MAIKVNFPSRRVNATIVDSYIKLQQMSILDGMVSYVFSVYLNEESRKNSGATLDFIEGSVLLEELEQHEGVGLTAKMYNFAKSTNKRLSTLSDSLQDV